MKRHKTNRQKKIKNCKEARGGWWRTKKRVTSQKGEKWEEGAVVVGAFRSCLECVTVTSSCRFWRSIEMCRAGWLFLCSHCASSASSSCNHHASCHASSLMMDIMIPAQGLLCMMMLCVYIHSFFLVAVWVNLAFFGKSHISTSYIFFSISIGAVKTVPQVSFIPASDQKQGHQSFLHYDVVPPD